MKTINNIFVLFYSYIYIYIYLIENMNKQIVKTIFIILNILFTKCLQYFLYLKLFEY